MVFKWREESLCTCVAASKLFSVLSVRDWDAAQQKMFVFLIIVDWKMSVYQVREALFRPGMNGDSHHRYRCLKT